LERLEIARFDHDPERSDGAHDASCRPVETCAVYTLDGAVVSELEHVARLETARAREE
jgi:hypothetical protein